MVVVRRLRSANSVRNASKTREGSDYKCKKSSQFAARAPVPQRRAARLSKSRVSRGYRAGSFRAFFLPKIRLKPISSQISSQTKYPPTVIGTKGYESRLDGADPRTDIIVSFLAGMPFFLIHHRIKMPSS